MFVPEGEDPKEHWVHLLRPKTLEEVLTEQQVVFEPNYLTAAAAPSVLPAKHLCTVCGFEGAYTCVRCGARFCSLRCLRPHEETRCIQFA